VPRISAVARKAAQQRAALGRPVGGTFPRNRVHSDHRPRKERGAPQETQGERNFSRGAQQGSISNVRQRFCVAALAEARTPKASVCDGVAPTQATRTAHHLDREHLRGPNRILPFGGSLGRILTAFARTPNGVSRSDNQCVAVAHWPTG